jgi:hypothetical protein
LKEATIQNSNKTNDNEELALSFGGAIMEAFQQKKDIGIIDYDGISFA